MESVSASNCRSVFASSTPTIKGTIDHCAKALGVGVSSVAAKIEAVGSYNEDTYLG